MTDRGPSRSVPVTPTKKKIGNRQDFDLIVDKLNRDYGLRIQAPDHTLTPRKLQELQRHGSDDVTQKIYGRLQYHFWKGGVQTLLEQFRQDAIASWRNRSRDSFTVRDGRPRTPQTLKATTAQERREWESLLANILEEAAPPSPQTTGTQRRLFGRVQSGPSNYHNDPFNHTHGGDGEPSVVGPSVLQSKRHSDDWSSDSTSTKRPRGDMPTIESPQSAARIIDSVPVRTKVGPMEQYSSFDPLDLRSANTSRTSFKSTEIFDANEVSRSSSQTTIEASPEEQERDYGPQQQSQDLFPMSSGGVDALNESYSRFEEDVNHDVDTQCLDPALNSLASDAVSRAAGIPTTNCALETKPPILASIQQQLYSVWPTLPSSLRYAPFPIIWEVTRIALHCDVDLQHVNLEYQSDWKDQNKLIRDLHTHPSFRGKAFPPRSSEDAWQASFLDFFSRGRAVVFSASMDWNSDKIGPMFAVRLQPLALDESYRLSRRFGPDRFLELLCPSLYSGTMPTYLQNNDEAGHHIISWLTREPHWFLGRQWAPFYVKDAGYKKPSKEVRLGPEPKPVVKDRVYFFAEDGYTFAERQVPETLPTKDQVKSGVRTQIDRLDMLDWALELTRNTGQPCLKLFQRTALVLSKTQPTVVFCPDQIRHQEHDLTSRTGVVMNDGAGRMSRSVALQLRDMLGLVDIPCAVQGRIGSAKGMWVIDVTDKGEDLWIETYPSQRKWICSGLDEEHRTLEIRSCPREPRSAHFNLQLLPILEDRAMNRGKFYDDVGSLLRSSLEEDLKSLKDSLRSPIQSRQWNHENSSHRHERIERGEVPYLGGLPMDNEEVINVMLDSGFHPTEQKYLQELFWSAQKRKCDDLQKRVRIEIGCSTHLYMIPDFMGILEEGEVHVSFSSKFQAGDFSDTILHDMDVLVARNPAHYISDIQKVKARFCPELHAWKNVVVFSTKGDSPLADLLSGGDYDGDMAWICWDPRLVDNFKNAAMPHCPDLIRMGYLRKDKETLGDLMQLHSMRRAATEMLVKSFAFNMKGSFLGICTNYKERLCYKRNNVNDRHAVTMSTLVSHLVDQAKQGIDFTVKDLNRLRRQYLKEMHDLNDPAYKGDSWNWKLGRPRHIIDKLKFEIAKPAIDDELEKLHNDMKVSNAETDGRPKSRNGDFDKLERQLGRSEAEYWDPQLASHERDFTNLADHSDLYATLLESLKTDLRATEALWKKTMGGPKAQDDFQFSAKVQQVYDEYVNIQPRTDGYEGFQNTSKTIAMLQQPSLNDPGMSQWALLKASVGFKLFYKYSPKFIWRMAGIQLCWLKALNIGGRVVPVIPTQYAILRPDPKIVKQITAREDGSTTVYDDDVDVDEYDE